MNHGDSPTPLTPHPLNHVFYLGVFAPAQSLAGAPLRSQAGPRLPPWSSRGVSGGRGVGAAVSLKECVSGRTEVQAGVGLQDTPGTQGRNSRPLPSCNSPKLSRQPGSLRAENSNGQSGVGRPYPAQGPSTAWITRHCTGLLLRASAHRFLDIGESLAGKWFDHCMALVDLKSWQIFSMCRVLSLSTRLPANSFVEQKKTKK